MPYRSGLGDSPPGRRADGLTSAIVGLHGWNEVEGTVAHAVGTNAVGHQIRFTSDHEWHEDQHGTRNIYHGTWEITGKRTVRLHDWEEEIRFSPDNYNEFTVVSFDHVLTKDRDSAAEPTR